MITILEYAKLSGHVYNVDRPYLNLDTTRSTINELPEKTKSTWAYMMDVDPYMYPSSHFYAQLYIKFNRGIATDAVIAVRGTVFSDINNLLIDAISWCTDVLGKGEHDIYPNMYFAQLIGFTNKAIRYIRAHFPRILEIKITGHSLGGALAQLMPLQAGYPMDAIVFNSPGVGHMPGVILQNWQRVYNINSRYGFINKIGILIGHLDIIDVPQSEAYAKKIFENIDITDLQISNNFYSVADQLQTEVPDTNIFKRGAIAFADEEGLAFRLQAFYKSYVDASKQYSSGSIRYPVGINMSYWHRLQNTLAGNLSKKIALPPDLAKIIKDQHTIDNLVPALQARECVGVAYSFA